MGQRICAKTERGWPLIETCCISLHDLQQQRKTEEQDFHLQFSSGNFFLPKLVALASLQVVSIQVDFVAKVTSWKKNCFHLSYNWSLLIEMLI